MIARRTDAHSECKSTWYMNYFLHFWFRTLAGFKILSVAGSLGGKKVCLLARPAPKWRRRLHLSLLGKEKNYCIFAL